MQSLLYFSITNNHVIMNKDKEIMEFLHQRVFDPILDGDYSSSLKNGVRYTIMRMENLDASGKVKYFWSAIVGTNRSISFAGKLRDEHAVRFEDVLEEFRVRFNDSWLRH